MATVEEDRIQLSKDQERAVTEIFGEKFLRLSQDETQCLSKVLFPDTHTDTIQVLGIERKLRPLTLKFSKRLFEALLPTAGIIQDNVKKKESFDMTQEVIAALKESVSILCEFYGEGWNDILEAVKTDDISIAELQTAAVTQQRLNGANDFLLGPLRVIVRIMQIHEVAQLKFNTMFTSRVSPESGIAL